MRLLLILTSLLLAPNLWAQVSVGVKPNRKQYVSYEPIHLAVTIANQTGGPLTLKNANGNSWIEFVVQNQSNRVIHKVNKPSYAGTTIPTAERVKSNFTLNNIYDLAQPGNYSAYAVVRTPNQSSSEGTRSATVYFTVNRGVPSWKTKVGVPGIAGDEREYRIINYSGDGAPKIYIQVQDVKRGHILATYSMGNVLSFRKALKAVDRENNLHVLFLTTPELYCHTVVNTSGKTIKRRYHKGVGNTHPALLTHQDGAVTVFNSVPYDPAKEIEERKKFHRLSEVPGGFQQ
ncbi:hypothetical protein ACFSW8_08845 [Rubritalea tangerina]|uniref:Uncharacterized protein n=2 Tax=Rubritalea tangerina TaxID=430798 RepID=A0ABW4ZAM6_9BACT